MTWKQIFTSYAGVLVLSGVVQCLAPPDVIVFPAVILAGTFLILAGMTFGRWGD